ncbi:MAG: lipoate--protein ligase [Bacteroidales bacterium]
MIILSRKQTNPYFNIAAEEFMLKHLKEDCFALWRNEPCVIVGKHQNTLAEIDDIYIKEHDIPVIRRLSGGGAVFHDLGNICFTFVKNTSQTKAADFTSFIEPILSFLQQLKVDARFEGRNDLTIAGKKFSGNADCLWQGRILHHGTLLYSSQIADMSPCLKVNPLKFEGKAVQSVRSRITNISEHLQQVLPVETFIALLEKYVASISPNADFRTFSNLEIKEIEKLAQEKYNTWKWNYGHSPRYELEKLIHTAKGGNIESHLRVKDGMVVEVQFYGDYFFTLETSELAQKLIGIPHQKEKVMEVLKTQDLDAYFTNVTAEELLSVLF